MRRLLTVLVVLLTGIVGLPAAATAAPAPLGSGSVLHNQFGPAPNQCTAAFAATDGRNGYLIVGHGCTGGTLYSNNVLVGTVVATPFPYGGYVVVRVTNTTAWELVPWVDTGREKIVFTGSRETPVGGEVCVAGPTVGLRCGTVLAKDQMFEFPWGTATGLTRTSICAEEGNLGAAYLTGDQAQGVPLGGPRFCAIDGHSYFQPVNKILSAFGLKLITG